MKRIVLLLLLSLHLLAGISFSDEVWISVELYKQNIFTVSECETLKTIVPREADILNQMAVAGKEGKPFEYEFEIWVIPLSGTARRATLYTPDDTAIDLLWDSRDKEFYLESGEPGMLKRYFTLDEFQLDVPAGQYRLDVDFAGSGVQSWYFIIPAYDDDSFPELPPADMVQDSSGQLAIEWSTVGGGSGNYNVWATNLAGFKDVFDEDFSLSHPNSESTPLGILASRGNYEAGVSAYEYGAGGVNYHVEFVSDTHLFSFKKPLPDYENKVAKASVSAGKDNVGSVSLSGQLTAIEADFLNGESVHIEIDSDVLQNTIELDFPINSTTFSKGRFSSTIKDSIPGATAAFKYDTKNHAFILTLKGYDLTGLACPIAIDISFAGGQRWQAVSNMLTARDQFTGTVIGDKIYVFGGNGNPDGINLKSGEVYDINSSVWSPIADNPHNDPHWGVEEVCGVSLNGKFYVFGGWGGDGPSGNYGVINFNEVYNPATNLWTSLAQKPTTTASAVPAVYDGKIYLFGGYDAYEDDDGNELFSETYSVVECFNPASNTWQSVPDMPKILMSPAIAVYKDAAYVIGGYDVQARRMNTEVMAYDFASNTWTRNYCAIPKEAARAYSYAAPTPVIDGKALLIGGAQGTPARSWACDTVTAFDIEERTWGYAQSLTEPREGHLAVVHDGTLFVLGGYADEEDEYRSKKTVYALLPVDVGLGDICYEASLQLDEDVVNGAKPCSPSLIQGLVNTLTVDKAAFRPGRLAGQDSFSVKGTFTTAADPVGGQPFRIHVGDETFEVAWNRFTETNGVYKCSNAPANGSDAIVSAVLDYTKCTYTLAVKNAAFTQYGTLAFGLNAFGSLLETDQTVHFNLKTRHVFEIAIDTEFDYGGEGDGDDEFGFNIEIETDNAVTGIEFTTPSGQTHVIPNSAFSEEPFGDGMLESGREYDEGSWWWGYYVWFYNDEDFLDYVEDGLYEFTVTFSDGTSQKTTAWFGIPGTDNPIPQPTQVPAFTSFEDNDILTSPVSFQWEPCQDPAARAIWMCLYDYDRDKEKEWVFSKTSVTGLRSPVRLLPGWYEAELDFEVWYNYKNEDGIFIDIGKYSECDYYFDVN